MLEQVRSHTKRALAPESWKFLGKRRALRRLTSSPEELLAALQLTYSDDVLLKTGVAARGADGLLTLSPVFGDASACFAWEYNKEQQVVGAISARGHLAAGQPPWETFVAEDNGGLAPTRAPVLLVESDADMFVLDRQRCRYTSAAGLLQISGERLRRLYSLRTGDSRYQRWTLTVVGCQPAQLVHQPTSATIALIQHLAEIASVFGLEPAHIFDVWLPAPADFQRIKAAHSFRDPTAVRLAVADSLKMSRYAPAAALAELAQRNLTYSGARRQLSAAVARSQPLPLVRSVDDLLTQFRRAFNGLVTTKFERIPASADGYEAFFRLAAANLAQNWFELRDDVRQAHRVNNLQHPSDEPVDRELLEQRLRIVDAMIKLDGAQRKSGRLTT